MRIGYGIRGQLPTYSSDTDLVEHADAIVMGDVLSEKPSTAVARCRRVLRAFVAQSRQQWTYLRYYERSLILLT